jgi:surface antigen
MHVAYVVAVNGKGTIVVEEMNYKGWNVVSTRTARVSEFRYIY